MISFIIRNEEVKLQDPKNNYNQDMQKLTFLIKNCNSTKNDLSKEGMMKITSYKTNIPKTFRLNFQKPSKPTPSTPHNLAHLSSPKPQNRVPNHKIPWCLQNSLRESKEGHRSEKINSSMFIKSLTPEVQRRDKKYTTLAWGTHVQVANWQGMDTSLWDELQPIKHKFKTKYFIRGRWIQVIL